MRRVIKGYRRRDWLKLQMMAECTYAAMFAMRDPKGKTVKDMFPELFKEEDDEPQEPQITEAEAADLQQMMQDFQW